jgi:hypothetical protein
MKPSESAAVLRNYLAQQGVSESQLRVPQLVEGMLGFYRTVRVSSVERAKGDMLLFQWGVFDWGHGESFEVDLTRQFITSGAFGDDAISQLRCTAHFAPTPGLRAIPVASRWCDSLDEIESFSAFIRDSAAYRATNSLEPAKVVLNWHKI